MDSRMCLAALLISALAAMTGAEAALSRNVRQIFQRNCDPPSICGGFPYQPTYGFCCDDKLFFFRSNVDACCGGEPYNSRTHVCCGGCAHPLPRDRTDFACCGKSFYRVSTDMCCGNSIIKRDCGARCCGGLLPYDSYTQLCCGGAVHSKLSKGGDGFHCCGKAPYDINKKICCDGCLHDREPRQSCCGNVAYNTATHICCGRKNIFPRNNQRCCGDRVYNPTTQICCGDRVFGRPYGSNTRCCFRYTSAGSTFVGLYNRATSRCCEGEILTIPSPGAVSCCSNMLYQHTSTRACCGGVIYNPVTHVCCGWASVNIKRSNHACCGALYYDTTRSACCCGRIVHSRTTPVRGVCCQGRWFPGNFRFCCGARPVPNIPGLSCCNHALSTVYSNRVQACCGGEVVSGPSTLPVGQSYSCCGSRPYNPRTHICCCRNCVYSRSKYTGCCGRNAYHSSNQVCCHSTGQVFPKPQFTSCCYGVRPYRAPTWKCCWFGRVILSTANC